jgi:hypothetical protein
LKGEGSILALQSEQVDRIKASGKMISIPGYM